MIIFIIFSNCVHTCMQLVAPHVVLALSDPMLLNIDVPCYAQKIITLLFKYPVATLRLCPGTDIRHHAKEWLLCAPHEV
jgi:hypothetical protein